MLRTCRLTAFLLALMTVVVTSGSVRAAPPALDAERQVQRLHPSGVTLSQSYPPFKPAQFCIACHQKQFTQWNGSAHSLAARDPSFRAAQGRALPEVAGRSAAWQCAGCHSPVAALGAAIGAPEGEAVSPRATDGVFCDVCHSLSGANLAESPSTEPGSAPLTLTPVAQSKDGPVFVKRGPGEPVRQCDAGFHQCVASGLYFKADLCGSCHRRCRLEGRLSLEASYDQWERSPYARRSILCQDCHMVELPTFRRSADCFLKPGRQEYRHYFNGANFALSYFAAGTALGEGDDELAASLMSQYQMTVDRLQSAADLELTPLYAHGRLAQLRVRVKNIRAGHDLPASLSGTRRMWLELSARDERGAALGGGAALRGDAPAPENIRFLRQTIPARGFQEIYFLLPVPQGVQRVGIEVKLRMSQSVLKQFEELPPLALREVDSHLKYGVLPAAPLTVDMVVRQLTLTTRLL